MTETEYLKATNWTKVKIMQTILRDILPGNNYGISKQELLYIKIKLAKVEINLAKSFELEEE